MAIAKSDCLPTQLHRDGPFSGSGAGHGLVSAPR
jgi:hypothetical protein